MFIGHRSIGTFSKIVINGNGKPRFACHVTFDVASNPVAMIDASKVHITKNVALRRLGCKKFQSIFIADFSPRDFFILPNCHCPSNMTARRHWIHIINLTCPGSIKIFPVCLSPFANIAPDLRRPVSNIPICFSWI